jgi:hypothetical protein
MGYIFEAEIGHIINTVRARTIGEADVITLDEIVNADIHPAIKAYFKADVEQKLQHERLTEVRSKRFPYSIPEVMSLQRQTDLLLLLHYQFDQQEFEGLLDLAVHFTFNFLCRPQFTLVEFLFENQRRVSTAVIERKLNYCADYEYLSILLKRYFSDHGLTEISYEEFKTLLVKIDHEIVAAHSSAELAAMTKTMVAFVQAGLHDSMTVPEGPKLPINAAIVFFEDKGLMEIKLRMEYERDQHELAFITIPELTTIIEEVRAIASGHQPNKQGPEGAIPSPIPQNGDQQVQSPTAIANEEFSFNQSLVDAERAVRAQEADSVQSAVTLPVTQQSASPSRIDLSALFSKSEQKRFAKSLFHKDRQELNNVLAIVGRASSWQEASLILDELFVARDINPQSKETILFTEKLFGYFNSTVS